MTAVQNFSEIGFPIPRGPSPPAYRRGVDWNSYVLSSLNVAAGQEANIQFVLGGVVWDGSVITSTAYYEERENYREYYWIDRAKNSSLPWPPDRDLDTEAVIRPAPMGIPYGLDVTVTPIPSTCAINNYLIPFAYWPGAGEDLSQCVWHIAEVPRGRSGVEILDFPADDWTQLPRVNNDEPVPTELEGDWAEVIAFQFANSSSRAGAVWDSENRTIAASTRWRVIRYVLAPHGDPPETPIPVDTNARRARLGLRAPDQAVADIQWTERILPDQNPFIAELRIAVPPSTHRWQVYGEILIPFSTGANVQFMTATAAIIDVARSLAWDDRTIWTTVGSRDAPSVRVKGLTCRVPRGSTVAQSGLVTSPLGWVYGDGFDEVRCADPVWIIADVLTRSSDEYADTELDWPSFLATAAENQIPVNLVLTVQPNPLETLAPVLAQTALRLHRRKGVWQFRRGLRMLLGSRQIVEPIVTRTPLIRIPRAVQITWGDSGWDELQRAQISTPGQPQPVPTASGTDVLPWQAEEEDAKRLGREALWPRQDPTIEVTVGPWGALLQPGDIVAVDPGAPSIVSRQENPDGTFLVELNQPQSTLSQVFYTTGAETVSPVTEADELPGGMWRIAPPIPGQTPTLRGAIFDSAAREWEVLSVSRSTSLRWRLVIEAAPDPARAAWIETGDEGCTLIDAFTRRADDWPLLDSCVGFG